MRSYHAPADADRAAPVLSGAVAPGGSAGDQVAPSDTVGNPSFPNGSSIEPPALPSRFPTPPATAEERPKTCSTEDGAKWIASKARYSLPDNPYPAVVQGDDYESIDAIIVLFVQVSGASKHGQFGIQDHRDSNAEATKITISGPPEAVKIELSETQIRMGRRTFRHPSTIFLFRTLGQVLLDVGYECTHLGVRGLRVRTRAYKDSVQIEFNYGPIVVSLSTLSNGPANPERLYVLDIIKVTESLMWANERPLTRSGP